MQVVKLKHPIKMNEVTITELELRRPKGADLRDMNQQKPSDQDIWLLARIAQKPMSVIDEMDGEDVIACTSVMRGFLGLGK